MTAAHVDVTLVKKTDIIFDTEDVNVQLFLICSSKNKNDTEDTDKKFLDLNCCNELDMLVMRLNNAQKIKQQESVLKKEKQVIEERIKKKKLYTVSKVLHNENYINAPKRVKP